MKTIFDYTPSISELEQIFCYDRKAGTMAYGFSVQLLPLSHYHRESSERSKLLDLARLLEFRCCHQEASIIWEQIPDIYQLYLNGHDSQILPL